MSEPVRITGRVKALAGTIEAPLSGRPCVAFEAIVEERTGAAPHRIGREVHVVPFVIGDVVVDTAGARVILAAVAYERSGVLHSPTSREAALLARHGERRSGRTSTGRSSSAR